MSQESENGSNPPDGFELEHFERNRYFQGKLMTAHDMATEQHYHAARLDTINRLISGTGIVSGLSISEFDHEDDELRVTIEPGLAIDREGRPIVVRTPTTRTIPAGDDDRIYLYIAYDEEAKDPVPVPGADATESEESKESRVLEIFELVARGTPPESYKTPPTIELPDFVESPERAAREALTTYHETHRDEISGEERALFIGAFERTPDGDWQVAEETRRRPFVYDNDMLFSLLLSHLTDGEIHGGDGAEQMGPGEGFLESELDQIDEFRVQMQDLEVEVAELRDELETEVAQLERELEGRAETWEENLQDVAEAWEGNLRREVTDLQDEVEAARDDLGAEIEQLRAAVRERTHHDAYKSLRTAIRGFDDVAEQFRHRAEISKQALEITEEVSDGITDEVYDDSEGYETFVADRLATVTDLLDALDGEATDESYTQFAGTVEALEAALSDGASMIEVVTAFDRMGEVAELLEPRYEVQSEV